MRDNRGGIFVVLMVLWTLICGVAQMVCLGSVWVMQHLHVTALFFFGIWWLGAVCMLWWSGR